MACKDIEERLPAYIDALLSPEDMRVIRDHLAQCPDCSMALADLRKTGELVRNLDDVEPPPWLTQKIMARVKEEAENRKGLLQRLFFPLSVKIPIQVFATLCIVVIALYLYKGMEPEIKVVPPQQGTLQGVPPAGTGAEPEKVLKQAPAPLGRHGEAGHAERNRVSVPPVQGEKETALGDGSARKVREGGTPPPYEESKKIGAQERIQDTGGVQKIPAPVVAPPAASAASVVLPKPAAPLPPAFAPRASGKDDLATARSGAKAEGKGKAFIADGMLKSANAEKGAPVTLTLTVKDVPAAAREVEKVLTELGARHINRLVRGDTIVVSAHLASPDMEDLVKKLKALGEVEAKIPFPRPSPGRHRASHNRKRTIGRSWARKQRGIRLKNFASG